MSFVCGTDVAPILAEPRDGAEQVTQALRGEPLTVDERRDGWARIRTAYDYPGWIREELLEEGAADEWMPPRYDDHVEAARAFAGTPYEWGGMTERGIDCSGLVHIAYRRTGRLVPRDAHEQEDAGAQIVEGEARPGDLVTYGDGDRADHVAIWLGDGRIIHATRRDGGCAPGVVEELERDDLRARRRLFVRLR